MKKFWTARRCRVPRPARGHEQICARLHAAMAASVANLGSTQLLAPRTKIPVSRSTAFCPDLALITAASAKLFLAVEIVQTGDHHADTVIKKEFYEHIRVPRLWMVDPRHDNVEIYHSTEFGLALKGILAGSEILSEKLVPEFQFVISELFATPQKSLGAQVICLNEKPCQPVSILETRKSKAYEKK